MKTVLTILLLTTAAVCRLAGAGGDTLEEFERQQWIKNPVPKPSSVDVKRVVKASIAVLHEREPELTPDESALYEKIVTMMATNPDFAVKLLETMMDQKAKPSPAFEFVLGNAYYEGNKMELAEKYYRRAVQDYPEFRRAWKNLAVLYYTTDRWAEAVKCFTKAVTLGDRDPSTLGLLAYCLEKQGNLVGAETDYLQASGLDPANTDWQEGLLRIYLKGKEFGRAEPLVRRLIDEKMTDAALWLDYASILIAQDRKLEAIAVLETGEAAGQTNPDEMALLGDLYADQGLAPEAAATYAKILGAARARGEHKLIYYAQVLIGAGRLADAEETLAAVKGKLTPAGRIAMLQTRADLAMAKKQWPEARRQIEALLALAPLDGHAQFTLGRIYLEEEDLPHASFAFEAATRAPEYAYRANLELANIAVRDREYAKAVAYLQSALKEHQSDAVEDYIARIRDLIPAKDKSG